MVEDHCGDRMMSAHPCHVLEKIAAEGRLRGGSGFIKGGYRCVCFTETPISEISYRAPLGEASCRDRIAAPL
jgi:hypothetical protein